MTNSQRKKTSLDEASGEAAGDVPEDAAQMLQAVCTHVHTHIHTPQHPRVVSVGLTEEGGGEAACPYPKNTPSDKPLDKP